MFDVMSRSASHVTRCCPPFSDKTTHTLVSTVPVLLHQNLRCWFTSGSHDAVSLKLFVGRERQQAGAVAGSVELGDLFASPEQRKRFNPDINCMVRKRVRIRYSDKKNHRHVGKCTGKIDVVSTATVVAMSFVHCTGHVRDRSRVWLEGESLKGRCQL